ncbi:hypothetical protein [Flavihumibacter sp. UBA7668]|uniref:hypothetical protein n=1 Tax=Flavihumibacter sp. UBA7668 TaxID=1946542 RepID=UPI0025C6349D|nr:hypothetical protein [Flavihumibacter sp. UBA7668]
MSGEKLYNLRAHPAVDPLNKEQAWRKLQELRKGEKQLVKTRKKRSPLFWYSVLTTAACLLLFSYLFIESKKESILIQHQAPQQLSNQKTSKENLTDIAPAVIQIQSEQKQAMLNPKKPVADSIPESSQLKQEKLSVMETADAVFPLDSITNQHKTIPLSPVSVKAAKRVFHLNELRDPDLPYTVNQEKKPSRPPVAKQQLEFSIKINLSN